MLNKKQHLIKKYKGLEKKNFSLYIYLPPLKANEIRKVRRYCMSNGMLLLFLPSSFSFTCTPISHGPAIICVISENIGSSELNLANLYQNINYVLKNKYQTHLSLKEKHENCKDFAKKFATVLYQNQQIQ